MMKPDQKYHEYRHGVEARRGDTDGCEFLEKVNLFPADEVGVGNDDEHVDDDSDCVSCVYLMLIPRLL